MKKTLNDYAGKKIEDFSVRVENVDVPGTWTTAIHPQEENSVIAYYKGEEWTDDGSYSFIADRVTETEGKKPLDQLKYLDLGPTILKAYMDYFRQQIEKANGVTNFHEVYRDEE